MQPMMQMDKFPMTLIRPLCLIREQLLKEYAQERGFHQQVRNCPFEDASHRDDMKGIITQLEQINPEFEYSLFHAIISHK